MPPRNPRGSYAVGDERRQRILDAAVEHFARNGYHASSLARIAHDVGITQGGLLHHFRSKEDLLLSVLGESEERDRVWAFGAKVMTATQHATALLELATLNATRPGLVRMFTVLSAEAAEPGHPAHAYFTERYARLVEHISAVYRRGIDTGEIRPGVDPLAVAEEGLAVMDGLQIQWSLKPATFDMVGRLRAYHDRLLRDITAAGTGLPAA
ncbi:TetR/AcrR family transcriptional regulator [Streptomyces sp. RTGN2]|uniref:TetR/AcrR family transcriptional regulator n=1 Tax=unclassified Streptomyces TaxID=2593676 RepID=UPI002554AC16|nr:TetR/AcrR family transcriptional regulator [Streptomyces sp. RTGN2]WSU56400.1 TetR/AcrR family transcriptional regulator [Streptomyces sp. NBC_01104]